MGTGDERSLLYVTYRYQDRMGHAQAFHAIGTPSNFQRLSIRVGDFRSVAPTEDCEGCSARSAVARFFDHRNDFDRSAGDYVYGSTLCKDTIAVAWSEEVGLNRFVNRNRDRVLR